MNKRNLRQKNTFMINNWNLRENLVFYNLISYDSENRNHNPWEIMHVADYMLLACQSSYTSCFVFLSFNGWYIFAGEDVQCIAEKSNEESEVCEVPFHGQLNYLLCDSPILEANIVQKNAKSCQQFRCDGCGRAYTRVDSLKRHQQKCDEFLASFQDRQETLQQEYYCNQCGKTYRRLDTLRRHQRLVCDKESNHSLKVEKTSL